MWWKVLGAAVLLAVVGAAAGYAVGAGRIDGPLPIGAAGPVPAQSPAAPTVAPRACLQDPDVPALSPDLPATSTTLRTGRTRGFTVSVDAPGGWGQTQNSQTTWKFAPAPVVANTYNLRVTVVASLNVSTDVYLRSRIAALRSTQRDGNIADFGVESEAGNTFVATYSQNGFCRVTVERVLSLGTPSAYVDLAVTGREADRQGLLDLLARTTESMAAG